MGCDSVVTLNLTVFYSDTTEDFATNCYSYTWNDSTYTQTGDYVQTLTNIHGCDSVVTLHLIINDTIFHQFSDESCNSYTWNDSTYYVSGDYVQTFTSANECDSVVTLHLTLYYDTATVWSDTACETFTWNDSVYTQSGEYIQQFSSIHGCDSTVTLHLTINHATAAIDPHEACNTFTWIDGVTYTESTDTPTVILTNAVGCDSVVTLNLTVFYSDTTEDFATNCYSYTWNDSTYTQTGDYVQTLTNIHGCDSTVTLHLTIHTTDSVPLTGTVCAGNTYNDYGFTYVAPYSTVESIHYDTIRTTNSIGCDSIVTLTLTVHPVDSIHFDGNVCAGSTYEDHGFTFVAPYSTVESIHYDTIRTSNALGCDSIVTLTLTVNPVDSILIEDYVCAGNTYNDYGFTYEAPYSILPAIHYDTTYATNANGCDSVVILALTVNPVDSVNIEASVSAGGTYNNYGFTYEAPFTTVVIVHYDTIWSTNLNGCDSIVTLALTVNPADSVHFDENICAGHIYDDHNFYYEAPYSTIPSVYYDTIRTTNIFGSDSIVSLTLTINPVDSIHFADITCAGSIYTNHGFTYEIPYSTSPSVIYDTVRTSNANGCDSIVTLTLTVNPVDSVHFNGIICAGSTYSENGFNYTAPYSTTLSTYYDTIHASNVNGCDSIVTLALTVNPVDSIHFAETICAGDTFNNHGFTFIAPYSTTLSVHYDTLRLTKFGPDGCDSIVTLALTVNPVDSVHFDEDVCAGNTFSDYGFTYVAPYSTVESIHYDTIRTTNSIGCDSIVTLTLTVHPVDSIHFDGNVCAGGTYEDHGFTFVAPYSTIENIHYDTIRTSNAIGCDSIVTLTLTVNPVDSILIEDYVCAGNTYNDYGFTFEAPYSILPSVHYDTTHATNVNGCDSVVILALTVNPVDSVNFEESISAGGTYNNHGFTYVAPLTTVVIVHYDTIWSTNLNGCDSIVTLALTVNPADSVHFDENICAGHIYDDHNFYYEAPYSTIPSVYYDTIRTTNIFGSDSIVSLTLTINPVDSVHFADITCAGSTYTNHGFTYEIPYSTSPSVIYDTVRTFNVNGCDSIVTLTLTVNPVDSVHFEGIICAGSTYSENGFNYTAPYSTTLSTYYDTIHTSNVNGCDSIVTLALTVNPVDSIHFAETICAGDTFNDHGFTYIAPYSTTLSVHYDTLRLTKFGPDGCDSIVTLALTVNPVDSVHFDEDVCAGNTFSNYGFTYVAPYSTVESIHYDTIRTTNANGCDSVVTLTLTVHPVDSIHFDGIVCAGETYTDHGFNYSAPFSTVASTYYDTIWTSNANGCDSIVTLTLTVNPVDSIYFNDTICAGGTYTEHGFTFTAPYSTTLSVHHDTIQASNINGCDSIVMLALTVNPVDSVHFDASVSAGGTYNDHGFSYNAPYTTVEIIHYDTIWASNLNGCDSVTTLTLTVNPVDSVHFDEEICAGHIYDDHNFHYEAPYSTIPSVYYDTIRTTNIFGSDSIVTLTLTVNPIDSVHFVDTICSGNIYANNGFYYDAPFSTTSSVYYDTVRTFNVNGCDSIVTLHLTINHSSLGDTTAVECDSFDWYEHTGITQSCDTLTHTFLNAVGCDSTVTLHLTILHNSQTTETMTTCDSATWHGHTYYASTDTATYRTMNAAGCDSIVTLNLTVNYGTHDVFTESACESYVWHGVTREQSGMYMYSYTNAVGCPSTDTLHLTINHHNTGDTTAIACETFSWYEHANITQSCNNLTHTFTNVAGCDSVVTLHLTVNHPVHTAVTEVVCDSYTWNGQTYTQSGNYTYPHADANGCTQVDTLHLTVHYSANTQEELVLCREELPYTWNDTIFDTDSPESGTFVFHFFTTAGCDSTVTLQLTVNEPTHTAETDYACEPYHWNGQTYTQSGTYTFAHPDANGCTQVDTLHLTFLDTTIRIVPITHNFCDEGSLTLEVQCALEDYEWSTGETSTIITVFDEGTYMVTATQGSCEVSTSYTIHPCEHPILLPNAFTPDGDGINDYFSLPENSLDQIGDVMFNIYIYNRWGTLVYTANSKYFRWDGEVNGQVYHNNVYNYVIEYRTPAGVPRKINGSITVL